MLPTFKRSTIISATSLILAFTVSSVQASVIILGTRLIYPSNQKSQNVQLDNKGSAPALVQSWIEDKQGNQVYYYPPSNTYRG